MLAKAGVDLGALECGAHWPYHDGAAARAGRRGEQPTALHNNCSGKHSGFVVEPRLLLLVLVAAPVLAALASWLPAVYAAQQDPAVALKEE